MENDSVVAKLKIKVGDHAFEAEGPVELIRSQFEAFKEIISAVPAPTSKTIAPSIQAEFTQVDENNGDGNKGILQKLLHVDGRVVSLTAIPTSTQDAALLVMVGHKEYRDNLAVTGQEIGDGLAQSGRAVLRVDRIMEKAIEESLVLKTGIKRGTRYRLTNQGMAKALAVAKELAASLP